MKKSSCSGPNSVNYLGEVGWAWRCVDQFQCPLVSSNHGETWRIGGPWFEAPCACGPGITKIQTLTSANVIAFNPGDNNFAVTWDGGHQSFKVLLFGVYTIARFSPSPTGAIRMKAYLRNVPHSYLSRDHGRNWNLIA
jgi:hypothetical protein